MTDETKRGPGRPPKAEAPKARTVVCEVKRDYWPTGADIKAGWPRLERVRVRAGTLIDVDPEAALDGVESGMLSRVKD